MLQPKLFNKINRPLLWIAIAGFIARLAFMAIFTDLHKNYYWEYGDIARYILDGKGFSYYHFQEGILNFGFQKGYPVYVSAHIPPAYVFYLIPFLTIHNDILRNILFNFSQILLSILTLLLLYKFVLKNFNRNAAITASLIFALLPEFIYTSTSIGPTVLYHLSIVIILTLLYDKVKRLSIKSVVFLGITVGLLINLRSEIALFALFIALFYLFQRKIKLFAIFSAVIVLLVLPWQVRNFMAFKAIVPMTTTNGMNFRIGHQKVFMNGLDSAMRKKLTMFEKKFDLELKMNNYLFNLGIKEIISDPAEEIKRDVIKVASLWIASPYDKRASNPIYLVPWLIMLAFSILGLIKTYSFKEHIFTYLFLLFHTVVAILYFVLPRYQTMMKIAMLPFAAVAILLFIDWLKVKYRKGIE
ncbi:MAG: 2 protein [Bacteroidota bacterium]|nr:2 protein [Bacteroidota bacterium]